MKPTDHIRDLFAEAKVETNPKADWSVLGQLVTARGKKRDSDSAESTPSGSFYTEYDFDLPGQPLCNVPMSLCRDPHEHPRRREAARKQLDEFLRNGTGTNHCARMDGDEHEATADGVCSYPTLSGCGPDETDAQVLCEPDL